VRILQAVIVSKARQFMNPESLLRTDRGNSSHQVPVVRIDPRYFHPTEVEALLGDPSKAKQKLGCLPEINAQEMCAEISADKLVQTKQHTLFQQHVYSVNVSLE
jgi:GDP-D-mannose dehydratase